MSTTNPRPAVIVPPTKKAAPAVPTPATPKQEAPKPATPAVPAPVPRKSLMSVFADTPSETEGPSGETSTTPKAVSMGAAAPVPTPTPRPSTPPTPAAPTTTKTGGIRHVPVPPMKNAATPATPKTTAAPAPPSTKGYSVEEANQMGLKGSQMFLGTEGAKSPRSESQPDVGTSATPTQAPAPNIAAAPKHVHPAILTDIPEKGKVKAGGKATPVAVPSSSGPTPLGDSETAGAPIGTSEPATAPRRIQAAEQMKGQKMTAHLVGYDEALMEQPIEGEEEAQTYLELTAEIPWAGLTDAQKYTRQFCLSLVVQAKEARHAMIRAILDGEEPIGMAVTLVEYPPALTPEERDRQTADAAARLGLPADDRLVTPNLDPAFEDDPNEPDVAPEIAEAIDTTLADAEQYVVGPDGYDPSDDDDVFGIDDGAEAEEAEAAPEQELPKAKASRLAHLFAETPQAATTVQEPEYDGPVSPTGIRLTSEQLRPIVEKYGMLDRRNYSAQGEMERKLGLKLADKVNPKHYQEENQTGTREAIIKRAIDGIIAEGTRLWEAEKSRKAGTPAPVEAAPVRAKADDNAGKQIALMQQDCGNAEVGCKAKRYKHARAKGKCFDEKCPCKGRCIQFVPPPSGESPDAEDVTTEGAAASQSVPDPALEERHALVNRAHKLFCAQCDRSAALHKDFYGACEAEGKSSCTRFVPSTAETKVDWLKLLDDAGVRADADNKSDAGGNQRDATESGLAGGLSGAGDGGGRSRLGSGAGRGDSSGPTNGQTLHSGASDRGSASEDADGRADGPTDGVAAANRPAVGGRAADETGTPTPTDGTGAGVPSRQGPTEGQVAVQREIAWTAALITREIEWRGGCTMDGGPATGPEMLHYSSAELAADGMADMDWWPVPTPDAEPESNKRRDEIVGRLLTWWPKAVPAVKGVVFPSTSYRKVLAAMELSAQVERYATAHKYRGMSPPDDELVSQVQKAALAYLMAHVPQDADTDFVTYRDACDTWGFEVGTPWAEIKKALETPPQEVAL